MNQLFKMNYINDITNFIFIEDEPRKADIIFIPGGSYSETAERAAELWCQDYAEYVMPSGKYSIKRGFFPGPLSKPDIYNKQYETEWEFLRDVLIFNGVREKAILREDHATNTYENAIYSKRAADSLGMDLKKAIITCKAFHARRCLMYYQTLFPETVFTICPTETQGVNRHNWFETENGINKVMGELERCGHQFRDIIMRNKYPPPL